LARLAQRQHHRRQLPRRPGQSATLRSDPRQEGRVAISRLHEFRQQPGGLARARHAGAGGAIRATLMRLFPRSTRGTRLIGSQVWLAACAGLWWALPVRPYRVIAVDPPCWMFDFTPDSSEIVTFSGDYDPKSNMLRHFTGQIQKWSCRTGARVGQPVA